MPRILQHPRQAQPMTIGTGLFKLQEADHLHGFRAQAPLQGNVRAPDRARSTTQCLIGRIRAHLPCSGADTAVLQVLQKRRHAVHILRASLLAAQQSSASLKHYADRKDFVETHNIPVLQPERYHTPLRPIPRLHHLQGCFP